MFVDGIGDLFGPLRCAGCLCAGAMLCGRCRDGLYPPPTDGPIAGVDAVLVPWSYAGAARSLVLALKLRAQRAAAEPLADAVCETVVRRGLTGSVLTWVPARRVDVKRRGFDHAELLARRVAGRLGIPVELLLRRVSASHDQAGLGAHERRANLQGVFAASSSIVPTTVVLVDDLVTTGATAASCAEALRAGGAARIEVLAPCRA